MATVQIAHRLWEGNGSAVNIDLGFIPDEVELIIDTEKTSPDIVKWSKLNYDENTAYGLLTTGTSGVVTQITDGDNGIISYDTKAAQALLPAPDGGPDQARTPAEYDDTADYSDTALYTPRSATAAGSCVWPTTRNGFVYELKTGNGTGTTEPTTWPTVPGEDVADSGTNVFTCRRENAVTRGYKGVTVGTTIQTDSKWYLLTALKGQDANNLGDADDWA